MLDPGVGHWRAEAIDKTKSGELFVVARLRGRSVGSVLNVVVTSDGDKPNR